MVGWFGKAAIAATGLCLLATWVPAQVTDPTKDEQKCESGTGKTLAKFVGSKGKCIAKCMATQRKATTPDYTLCLPQCTQVGCSPTIPTSYADPDTNTCIFDPVKGAETKAGAGIAKGCVKDCPECYSGAQCNDNTKTNPWVVTTEGDIDAPISGQQLTAFPRLIYCLETAGTTPTKDQAKCEDGTSKALAKLVGAKNKCYSKCFANFYKGKIPGGCNPPASDPATAACINDPTKGAEAKAKAAIVKACTVAVPSCYSGGNATAAANSFVTAVEQKVDQRTPQVACGSPSGAFVE
jgi:hypothetical protein